MQMSDSGVEKCSLRELMEQAVQQLVCLLTDLSLLSVNTQSKLVGFSTVDTITKVDLRNGSPGYLMLPKMCTLIRPVT